MDERNSYVCDLCGWAYNEAEGLPEQGIAPGTKWEDLPEDFTCPICGADKLEFQKKEPENGPGIAPEAVKTPPEPVRAAEFDKAVTRKFTYGLFVLTARDGDKDNGCVINTAIQAASEPLRVSIAVNKANYTHDMILRTGAFNLSFLSEDSQFSTYQRFGFQSGRDTDKLQGAKFRRAANGIVYLTEEVNAYLSGKVVQVIDLGSHSLFIADVTGGEVLSKTPSVSYAYYFEHIKPKPEAEKTKKTGWVCTICGYVYEGEELPPDFICPLCKHPASDFKKL